MDKKKQTTTYNGLLGSDKIKYNKKNQTITYNCLFCPVKHIITLEYVKSIAERHLLKSYKIFTLEDLVFETSVEEKNKNLLTLGMFCVCSKCKDYFSAEVSIPKNHWQNWEQLINQKYDQEYNKEYISITLNNK